MIHKITMISIIIVLALSIGHSQTTFKNDGQVRLAPRMLNYQGYLTDTLGNPVTNPSVSMTFAIFNAISAGSQKWTENQTVGVNKGIFSVLLGSITPIPDSVFVNSTSRWLQLTIGGQTMTPRTQIVSAPYSYTSTYSDTAAYARNSAPDNDWVYRITDTADTTLQMGGRWGLARLGNILYGNADSTHVNFGVTCTTGTSGQYYKYCTVTGGYGNKAGQNYATVGGGYNNAVSNEYATVAGGSQNTARGIYGTVAGGNDNIVDSAYATVGGGYSNAGSDQYATVGGGYNNTASANLATVAGGYENTARGTYAFVGGGHNNIAGYDGATVGGGENNLASSGYVTVGGGQYDTASAYSATVGGGYANAARGSYATVGGGNNNTAGGQFAFVGGGTYCAANSNYATISGGAYNTADSLYTVIGGGRSNTTSGSYAAVVGGYFNEANVVYCGVGSGYSNLAGNSSTDTGAFVAGGYNNSAIEKYTFIGGGLNNTANGQYATLAGGYADTANGSYATVPGGYFNKAVGDYSFASGRRAKANNQGCFVWGDATDANVSASVDNRWVARCSGGVYFYTNSGLSSGAYLAAGGSSWSAVSDRNMKENFMPVDGSDVLSKVLTMPITTWNYKSQDPSIRHIGPMAQDFAGFGVGEDDKHITTIDADGVALAAIQELAKQVEELKAENKKLQERIETLENR